MSDTDLAGRGVDSRKDSFRTLADVGTTNWQEWHDAYTREGSGLAGRLTAVQSAIRRFLDGTSPAPVRVVSACAGDGRDLLGVLSGRADTSRVSALLVEYDAGLADRAKQTAALIDAEVEVRQADAARSDEYQGAVPANLVLLCGIFGNIPDHDIRTTIHAAPELCAAGAEVVWTRHRGHPDLTPSIRRWFSEAGFTEVKFMAPDDEEWSVGVHRLDGPPASLVTGRRWFSFYR